MALLLTTCTVLHGQLSKRADPPSVRARASACCASAALVAVMMMRVTPAAHARSSTAGKSASW